MVNRSKAQSLWLVTAAYVVAVGGAGAAWLLYGPSATGRLWLDAFTADVIATLVVFVFSRAYRNSSFYDAFWSVIPPLLLIYWWAAGPLGLDSVRCWLVAIVVMYWAIRLTGNWAYSFPGLHHEDWRYPQLRDSAGRLEFFADLFGIHLIPTVQVFLGMLPVYVAVTRPGDGLMWLSWIAFAVGIAAVTLELVADTQMHRFVRDKKARRGDGPWTVGMVAAPELLRRDQLLVRPGPVRSRRRTRRCLVAVRRGGGGHGRDVPRRQHSDDGEAQPGPAPAVSGRDRSSADAHSPPAPKGRRMTRKPRVVIAGLGDSGLLTAIKLARHADVVGISAKPALVSGQELGLRLARPKDWARDNWISFDKYRGGLDRVRTVQATLTGLDLENRTVSGTAPDGSPITEPYDVLVISTGGCATASGASPRCRHPRRSPPTSPRRTSDWPRPTR